MEESRHHKDKEHHEEHHKEHHEDEKYISLIKEIHKLGREIMATKAEVLQAIADEKAQVLTAIEAFNKQVQELKDALANGTAVTAADLDDITSAVHDIFVP